MHRRFLILLLLASAAVAAAGCGSSSDSGSAGGAPPKDPTRTAAQTTPEDEVGATVLKYYQAYSKGDGATACALLSEKTKPALIRKAQRSNKEARGKGCEQIISQFNLPTDAGATIQYVEVHGDKAVAISQRRRIKLEKTPAGWRILSFSRPAKG